jgi:hypothetical protein
MIYSLICLDFRRYATLLILEVGLAMSRQPSCICPKLLLEAYFSSVTPKADPILDDKALNLSLISVCPWKGSQATHMASP